MRGAGFEPANGLTSGIAYLQVNFFSIYYLLKSRAFDQALL